MIEKIGSVMLLAGLAATAVAQAPSNQPPSNQPSTGEDYQRPPVGAGGPPANAMFTAIDADGDGAITTRELRKAIAALKKFDTDKDGRITLAEVASANTTANSMAAGAGGRPGFGNQSSAFGAGGDPRPGGPDLMQFDRNGDGQLSADEMPTQMMGLARGADQNRDGKLDAQELQMIQQRIRERVRGDRPLPPGVSAGPQGITRTPQ